MESEVVRRRMNMIASHLAPSDYHDNFISSAHLLPMNCSSSLNSAIRRCDNRMYFARQGSAYQAFFMRQSLTEQNSSEKPCIPQTCSASDAPLFSRAVKMEPSFSNIEAIPPAPPKDCISPSTTVHPCFARPNKGIVSRKKMVHSKKNIYSSQTEAIEWSPRMDVAESGRNYIMTVEIPGVTANDIRVEVNNQNLRVMGMRTSQCWRAQGCSNDSISSYHKREIYQGAYQVVWPLPSDVNKECVSAEFVDGLLQIIIPKLCG